MDKETALVSKIKTFTSVPVSIAEKPNGITNCVVILKVSSNPKHSINKSLGISRDRYQMDCWGSNFAQARQLADLVIVGLDCLFLDGFNCSYLENDISIKDLETGLWRIILDFFVW
jgi:hypothetical protein